MEGLRELHALGLRMRPLTATNRMRDRNGVCAVHGLATDEGRRVAEERRGRG